MDKILIIGSGGLAREFTSWFKDSFEIVGYASIKKNDHTEFNLPGILYTEIVTPRIVGTNLAVVCISDPVIKKRVYNELSQEGFSFPSIVHRSSCIQVKNLKEGVIISPKCVISSNVVIGKLTYINFSCGIGHDAIVGDFVQINPGSQIGRGCKIGDQVLLGSNSVLLENKLVGDRATVASGAVVFSGVSKGVTVIGNPAKRMTAFDINL